MKSHVIRFRSVRTAGKFFFQMQMFLSLCVYTCPSVDKQTEHRHVTAPCLNRSFSRFLLHFQRPQGVPFPLIPMVFLLAVTRTTAPLTLTWTCEAGGINGFWFPLFASPSGVPEMIQHQTPEASAAGTRRGAHSCCTATDYRLSLLLLFACCLQWGDHSLRI